MMKWWGWGDPNKTFNCDERPGFLAFLKKVLGKMPLRNIEIPTIQDIDLPTPRIRQECLQALSACLRPDQLSISKEERLNHCYGKSFRDLLRVLQNKIVNAPDLI